MTARVGDKCGLPLGCLFYRSQYNGRRFEVQDVDEKGDKYTASLRTVFSEHWVNCDGLDILLAYQKNEIPLDGQTGHCIKTEEVMVAGVLINRMPVQLNYRTSAWVVHPLKRLVFEQVRQEVRSARPEWKSLPIRFLNYANEMARYARMERTGISVLEWIGTVS